ncbi:MAG: hypothetical protein ACE5GM_10060 [bacterium]
MGFTNYGFPSSAGTDLSNVLEKFEVTRGYEGPQIKLEWKFFDSNDIDALKIVKKIGAYPLHVSDGILAWEDTISGFYADLEVTAGELYYYTIFIQLAGQTEWVFSQKGMGKALALQTGYYENKLWELLPEIYRIHDEQKETLNKKKVLAVQD